jgi:hypothetical protein
MGELSIKDVSKAPGRSLRGPCVIVQGENPTAAIIGQHIRHGERPALQMLAHAVNCDGMALLRLHSRCRKFVRRQNNLRSGTTFGAECDCSRLSPLRNWLCCETPTRPGFTAPSIEHWCVRPPSAMAQDGVDVASKAAIWIGSSMQCCN